MKNLVVSKKKNQKLVFYKKEENNKYSNYKNEIKLFSI